MAITITTNASPSSVSPGEATTVTCIVSNTGAMDMLLTRIRPYDQSTYITSCGPSDGMFGMKILIPAGGDFQISCDFTPIDDELISPGLMFYFSDGTYASGQINVFIV